MFDTFVYGLLIYYYVKQSPIFTINLDEAYALLNYPRISCQKQEILSFRIHRFFKVIEGFSLMS